ncbi:hypothetical protein [Helicobacter pylori]|uniref:hypothetical protein n=1 Tax=Helicobacter pylori TaxID=210 RepID=UPI001AA90237|nr:hypothetical protein [Helicobacter pylori]GHQ40002.1 hypothetical protein JP0067_06630 [Helicobacter pylori]GHQ90325.1 hypothetical protein JP0085_06110 [Helicobacter pylori]GHS17655.1 hypothetical protein JP0117_06620 [Helicobacter pylori]
MEENRDGHAIVSNVIKSLEEGGFFSPSDRVKFVQTAREHGIEGSVIEEVVDIAQTISLIHRMKIGLIGVIWQERRRKPCALSSKRALMKI